MGLNKLWLVEIFNGQMTSRTSPQTKNIRQGEEGVTCDQAFIFFFSCGEKQERKRERERNNA